MVPALKEGNGRPHRGETSTAGKRQVHLPGNHDLGTLCPFLFQQWFSRGVTLVKPLSQLWRVLVREVGTLLCVVSGSCVDLLML